MNSLVIELRVAKAKHIRLIEDALNLDLTMDERFPSLWSGIVAFSRALHGSARSGVRLVTRRVRKPN